MIVSGQNRFFTSNDFASIRCVLKKLGACISLPIRWNTFKLLMVLCAHIFDIMKMKFSLNKLRARMLLSIFLKINQSAWSCTYKCIKNEVERGWIYNIWRFYRAPYRNTVTVRSLSNGIFDLYSFIASAIASRHRHGYERRREHYHRHRSHLA